MTETGEIGPRRGGMWRVAGWAAAGSLLLWPWLAGFPWTLSDYLFVATAAATIGLVVELAVRLSRDLAYRAGAVLAVLASALLVWVNGAVGFLGSEDNPANLVFAAVILTAVAGAALAGFRAAGVSRAMFAAAALQLLIGAAAIPMGWAPPGLNGLYEVVIGTTLFGSLWLLAAGLFRRAARAARGRG